MKVKFLLFTLALGTLVACDPLVDDSKLDITTFGSAEELMEGAYIKQYSDAEGTKESKTGRYVEYSVPNAPSVVVSYTNAAGATKELEHGKNYGIVQVKIVSAVPTAAVTFNITYTDATGAEIVYSQDMTVETVEMTSQEILLVGEVQYKTWTWDTESPVGCCWGNGGTCFLRANAEDIYNNTDSSFKWWGINDTDGFEGQVNHTGSEGLIGDGDIDAYMVISMEDGITCYNANDEVIRSGGSWEITDWDESSESPHPGYLGLLNTSAGAILWPYAINTVGRMPTQFAITKLTEDKLMLVFPDDSNTDCIIGAGYGDFAYANWMECTFWYFTAVPYADERIASTSEEEVRWTWATSEVSNGSACWGNEGYAGGDCTATSIPGHWWGCTTNEFDDQFGPGSSPNQTAQTVSDEGEGAYMIFDENGTLTKYNSEGSKVGEGKWSIDLEQTTDKGGFGTRTWGLLTTTGDGILLPFQINGGGTKADWFDIAYLNDDLMMLVNQRDEAGFPASWGEATWWRFESTRISLSSGEDEGE